MKFRFLTRWRYLRKRLHIEEFDLRVYIWPLATFLLISFGLVYTAVTYNVDQHGLPWTGMFAAGGNSNQFCEINHFDKLIRQPSNTWSNMGYLFVGLIFVSLGIADIRNRKKLTDVTNYMVKYPAFSILLGVGSLYLFAGSFLYHASLIKFFQKMDVTGIYLILLTLIGFGVFKLFPVFKTRDNRYTSSHKLIIGATLAINVLFFSVLWKINTNVLFPIMIVITFVINGLSLKYRDRHSLFQKYLFTALMALFLAGTIWILDRTDTACQPGSILQGHAIWHLLTATSLLFIYLFYRSKAGVVVPKS